MNQSNRDSCEDKITTAELKKVRFYKNIFMLARCTKWNWRVVECASTLWEELVKALPRKVVGTEFLKSSSSDSLMTHLAGCEDRVNK